MKIETSAWLNQFYLPYRMLQVMRNSNENVERLGLSQDGSRDVKCRDRDIFFIVYVISFGFLSKVQILSLVKK